MAVKVGINGFGRIGRNVFRTAIGDPDIDFVAVNDLTDTKTLAHLLKYDSVLGNLEHDISATENGIKVEQDEFRVFSEKDPAAIPWEEVGAEIVIESTGRFTKAEDARKHLRGTVKKVIISAPAKIEDITIVLGVNEDKFDPAQHTIISNASCTTNGLAPVAKVLRDARAAAINIVPSSTGAARAVGLVIPELKGRFTGMAFRVPTSTVSVVDFTAQVGREVTKDEVNGVFKEASQAQGLKGI